MPKSSKFKEYRDVARPARIEIRAVRTKTCYAIEIRDGSGEKLLAFDSPETPLEIRRAGARLRAHLETEEFRPSIFAGPTDCRRIAAMRKLAELGRALIDALFPADELTEFLALVGEPHPARVELSEEMLSHPWELLYADTIVEGAAVAEERFLGRFIRFNRMSTLDGDGSWLTDDDFDSDDPFAPGRFNAVGPVATGRIFDDALEALDAPIERHWHHVHRDTLDIRTLEALSGSAKEAGCSALLSFMGEPHEIIHFDCHAECETAEREYAIRVRSGYLAGQKEVSTWDFRGNDNVLVVLNCCSSDVPDTEGESPAQLLHRNGGRSIIGASARIYDAYMLVFAKALYDQLLGGAPVGEALFGAQNQMIGDTGNPLALAYTLHGSPAHRLVPGP